MRVLVRQNSDREPCRYDATCKCYPPVAHVVVELEIGDVCTLNLPLLHEARAVFDDTIEVRLRDAAEHAALPAATAQLDLDLLITRERSQAIPHRLAGNPVSAICG